MTRIWRQNPLLRICTPLLIGVYLCTDYRSALLYSFLALTLFVIFLISKKIVWISSALFFLLISIGSSWNALLPAVPAPTLCPTDWEPRPKMENHLSTKIEEGLKGHYSEEDIGIIIAFLVGDTSHLSPSIKAEYKAIGISHLLAVSGMHIGLIFGLLTWLLKKITRDKYPAITTPIALICIWLFCYMCQFPPSLNRAAIMFTFLHLGKIISKKTHSLNLLCLSLVAQIAWCPSDKENWGLILSHLAVMGIVLFHRPVQLQIKHWHKMPRIILENITITLHAQWSTGLFLLPQTMQFPAYFLIANIILIPISSGLLYLLILLIAVPPAWSWEPIHQLVHFWIKSMNAIVSQMNQWPMPQVNLTEWSWAYQIIWLLMGLFFFYLWNQRYRLAIWLLLLALSIWTMEPILTPHKNYEIHLWRHNGQPCMLYKTAHDDYYLGQEISHSFLPKAFTQLHIQ
jgi:ComEC/Rec2-related protein